MVFAKGAVGDREGRPTGINCAEFARSQIVRRSGVLPRLREGQSPAVLRRMIRSVAGGPMWGIGPYEGMARSARKARRWAPALRMHGKELGEMSR